MPELKKLIPEEICLSCDVCCRFPYKNSKYAPVFLRREITSDIKPYLKKSGRVRLRKTGDTYACHFFNPAGNRCSIYPKRPFDCAIYPFIVTFDEKREHVILGFDTKCPFAHDNKNEAALKDCSKNLLNTLEQKKYASLVSERACFIGDFDGDVRKISVLENLTKLLVNNPAKKGFRKLTLKDKSRFDRFFEKSGHPSSNRSFVNLYIWKHLYEVWWRGKNDSLEILLESGSDFLPYESMTILPDYIYLREDLAGLRGNKYRHKRANCNFFLKHNKFRYLRFNVKMKNECLRLFKKWLGQKKKKHTESHYLDLLENSFLSHKTAMGNYSSLGLTGRVIKIKDRIRGYIFGFELAADMFCVLLEICDPAYKGLPQFIFRELCREMSAYRYINTMDDSGLENLRFTKLSYHPIS